MIEAIERTSAQIDQMRKNSSSPFQVENFLSTSEISAFLKQFKDSENKEFKTTGPVCAPFHSDKNFNEKIQKLVGPCQILNTSLFFATTTPHILHMDAPKDLKVTPFKAVLLPLMFETDRKCEAFDLSFFTFKNRWYGYPAKFFKDEANEVYSPHNKPIYDYSQIEDIDLGPPISNEIKAKWLPHLKTKWTEGLSIDKQFDWKPGSAIVFDSFQIHCSSDFRKFGVKLKIGLSIFTMKE